MNLPDPKEFFIQYLKQRKQRLTPERFEVLDAVLKSDGHFDADEIFVSLKRRRSKVSRATVYNTLETLTACGILVRYRFGERLARYECAYGADHHHHIICRRCGRIEEFIDKRIDRFARDVTSSMHYTLEHAMIHIYGMCEACQSLSKDEG
jgi:Fur family transcriptional regulator, ferric uptake regulator